MPICEGITGDTIDDIAASMVAMADNTGEAATATFNGVDLTAEPGADAARIVEIYLAEVTPSEPQARPDVDIDTLVDRFAALDFTDHNAVISWLEEYQLVPVDTPFSLTANHIVSVMVDHGYEPKTTDDLTIGDDDEEGRARDIIGNALHSLANSGAIPEVIHRFAQEWRERFGHAEPMPA